MKEAISGHQWSSVVISGPKAEGSARSPFIPVRRHVISGHQWSSVVISGPFIPVRRHVIPTVSHALDIDVTIERGQRERVLQPHHVDVREQHGAASRDEVVQDVAWLPVEPVRETSLRTYV